jgi:hypothetical protein
MSDGSYVAQAANAVGARQGKIIRDSTVAATVRYLDCSAFAGRWVKLTCDAAFSYVWVNSATPATTPTTVATGTGADVMDFCASGEIQEVCPKIGDCIGDTTTRFLAYATAAGTSFRVSLRDV